MKLHKDKIVQTQTIQVQKYIKQITIRKHVYWSTPKTYYKFSQNKENYQKEEETQEGVL